jgi:LPXTG-motif cell wall-anchored protein
MNPRPLVLASLALLAVAVPARAATTTVQAVDSRFQPATATVSVGDKVTWHNSGSMPHDVTGSGFASGNLDPGKSYSWTPSKAGTYAYVCSYHQSLGMKGTVVVRTAGGTSGLPKTGGDRTALGLLIVGIACAAGVSLRYGWSNR